MYKLGDRVMSTDRFASQFPRPIQCNDGRPLVGVVKRVRGDGLVVVHWDGRVAPVTLHADYIKPEAKH